MAGIQRSTYSTRQKHSSCGSAQRSGQRKHTHQRIDHHYTTRCRRHPFHRQARWPVNVKYQPWLWTAAAGTQRADSDIYHEKHVETERILGSMRCRLCLPMLQTGKPKHPTLASPVPRHFVSGVLWEPRRNYELRRPKAPQERASSPRSDGHLPQGDVTIFVACHTAEATRRWAGPRVETTSPPCGP
jgi:hypothetical protein